MTNKTFWDADHPIPMRDMRNIFSKISSKLKIRNSSSMNEIINKIIRKNLIDEKFGNDS